MRSQHHDQPGRSAEPHLQSWLAEGVSLECHTYDSSLSAFAGKRFRGPGDVRSLRRPDGEHSGQSAVAFRMPCCDSPTRPARGFSPNLQSHDVPGQLSVDRSLGVQPFHGRRSAVAPRHGARRPRPRDISPLLAGRPDVRESHRGLSVSVRHRPAVLGVSRRGAQRLDRAEADNRTAHRRSRLAEGVDATVVKQGIFTLVFHPHNWIRTTRSSRWSTTRSSGMETK